MVICSDVVIPRPPSPFLSWELPAEMIDSADPCGDGGSYELTVKINISLI